jgi:hypothetical protein
MPNIPQLIFIGLLSACASGRNKVNSNHVQIVSSLDGTALNGTLEKPLSVPRAPVLMLTGSGKTDRDETTPADLTFSGKQEKLFLQIANALSESGHPTLRYDKRGVLDDTGRVDRQIWKTADREHLIQDAIDAAKFLLQHTGSQHSDLIILGHSEGTILAVEAAIALGGHVKGHLLCCKSCGILFFICKGCYRGHRYCSDDCRRNGYEQARRAARLKHSQSLEAKLDHRDRMKAYRKGHSQKTVMDKTSMFSDASLGSAASSHLDATQIPKVGICICCKRRWWG